MPTPNADDPLRTTDHTQALQLEALPSPAAPPPSGTHVLPGEPSNGAVPDAVTRTAVPGYEVLSELGRGGMGVVYKARHLRLGRFVALKMVLHAEHAQQGELLRFLSEAEAVAQLQHPNIVQLFDSGQHAGVPYFTLELVEGGTLADKERAETQYALTRADSASPPPDLPHAARSALLRKLSAPRSFSREKTARAMTGVPPGPVYTSSDE